MAYNPPTYGETGEVYTDNVRNSLEAVRTTADSALAKANSNDASLAATSQTADEALEKAASAQAVGRRFPLDAAADYGVLSSRTPSQNSAALARAIADAIDQSRALRIESETGEPIDIAGTLVIPPGADVRIFGNKERTTLRATVQGQPVFRVRGKALIEGFEFTNTAGRDVTGLSDTTPLVRGESETAQHCGVSLEYDCSGTTLRNIRGHGLHAVVVTTGYDEATGAVSANLSQNILMDDIEGEDVAFVILSRGVKDARYNNVRGSYNLTPGTGAPPHLIYMSEDANTPAPYSQGVHLSNLTAWDGETGAAVKFAGIKGGSITNLKARNCRGVLDVMNASDALISDVLSIDDNASAVAPGPVKASVELLTCQRVTVQNVRIDGKEIDYYRGLWSNSSDDCVFKNIDIVTRHTTTNTNEYSGDVYLYGDNNLVQDVSVTTLGANRGSGFVCREASNLQLVNPRVSGNYHYGVFVEQNAPGLVIDADLNLLQVDTTISGAKPFFYHSAALPVTHRTPAPPSVELDRPIAFDGRVRPYTADGWIIAWDSGQYAYPHLAGTWSYLNGEVRNEDNLSVAASVVDVGESNVEIETRIKSGGAGAGVTFRAIDVNDFLLAQFVTSGGTVRVLAREAGGATATLASVAFTHSTSRYYDFKVIAHGDQVEVYVDGVKVLTHTLSAAHQTKFGAATKHGYFASAAAAARWRWIRIRGTD